MPDIKTALQSAIEKVRSTPAPTPQPAAPAPIPSDWDDEGGAAKITEASTNPQPTVKEKPVEHLFQPTTNVSRETFNFVRDNPGVSRMRAMDVLTAKGMNPRSVSALLSQMHIQGMLRGDALNGYYVTIPEYRPIKSGITRKAAKQPRRFLNVKPTTKRKAATPSPSPAVAEKSPGSWTPDVVLNGLSVIQAKAVYEELKKLFH